MCFKNWFKDTDKTFWLLKNSIHVLSKLGGDVDGGGCGSEGGCRVGGGGATRLRFVCVCDSKVSAAGSSSGLISPESGSLKV